MATTPPTVKVNQKVSSPWLPNGGTITQLFGTWEYIPQLGINAPHEGMDIGTAYGSPVQLPQGSHATVTGAGWDSMGGGNFVQLKLDDGSIVDLFHLKDVAVKVGQDVSGSTLLGHVDSTGNSTGNHLHFQVMQAGKAVDPWGWLQGQLGQAAGSTATGGSINPLDAFKNVNDFFGHLISPGHDPCSPPSDEIGVLRVIDAFTCPANWWKGLFVGIGVVCIGVGVFIYFFKEEATAVREAAPLIAEAAA